MSLLMANSAGYAGNTLTQSYNKRLQLGVTSAATPTQTIFSLTNDFQLGSADNGNVWKVTNNLDSTRTQTFTYDSLNRLWTAGTASTWGDSYVYDPWGNLYQMNVTQGSGQNLQQNMDTNNRFLSSWTYDYNGNILAGAGATNSYDAENRLVGQSPGSFSFMYDGDGAKVRKSNGSVTTLYWRDLADKVLAETDGSGNPQQDYIYLNGVMIARSDVTHGHPRLDYYYIHDHLGTTRMITNPVGTVCYDADYFPYGSEQATPTNNCAQNSLLSKLAEDSARRC